MPLLSLRVLTLAATLSAGALAAPGAASAAGDPPAGPPVVAPPAVTKTVSTTCTWTPVGETTPRTAVVPVEVTATVPASTARDAIVEVKDISTTIGFSPETGAAMWRGGVFRANLTSQRLRVGKLSVDLAHPQLPPVSLNSPFTSPTAGPLRGVAGGATALADGNAIAVTYDGFDVAVGSREPYGGWTISCKPTGDATLATIAVLPGPDAPVVTQVVGTAFAGIGGLIELRGHSLAAVKRLQLGGRSVPFWKVGGRLLALLPSRPAGTYQLEAASASGASIGITVRYTRLV